MARSHAARSRPRADPFLHALRHSAASLAVAAGESILFVQAQLGHANVRTTQRYAHADHQAHRAAAARVADYLGE